MILETCRLILRPWEETDAEECYRYAKDPQVGPIAGWPIHTSVEDSRKVIREILAVPETFAIVLKETGLPIGSIGLHFHSDLADRDDEVELGYWIGVPYWGQGIAQEAAKEMLRHVFQDLGLNRVWCGYYDGNIRSKRVQEKLGFVHQWTKENVPVPQMGENRKGDVNLLTKERWEILYLKSEGCEDCNKYRLKFPTKEEAEKILKEAEGCNPGPWGNHSRTAAHCAEAIASRAGMNAEKAYVLGLLHDIGRKFGKRHLGHVSDGYSYMMSLGYEDVARVCLTHSFNEKSIDKYIGKFDTTEEETKLIKDELNVIKLDDYDRLIQLCDSISGAEGVMDIIDRMTDVKIRYGGYDQGKWDKNLKLKSYFEDKMQMDLYEAVDKEHFKP